MFPITNIAHIKDLISFLPIGLLMTFWIAFPVWLAIRRSQGLIKLEKRNKDGESEPIGMYLEIAIFLFVIPFTTFFFFIVIYMILLPLVKSIDLRFQKSIEAAFMLMSICLFLYIYAAERKIYKETMNKRVSGEDDPDSPID